MFETSLVRGRSTTALHRYRVLTLSIAVHSAAIAAILTATLISTRLPTNPPLQMEMPTLFRVSDPPPPPKLGNPEAKEDAKPAPAKQTAPPVPHPVTADAAPALIPEQPAVTSDAVASTSTAPGGNGTGEKGVRGGDPNGIGTDESNIGNPPVVDPGPLRAGIGDVKAPVVIRRVIPEYPRVAIRGHMNGWVIVECIIDKSGRIRDARIVRSSFGAFEQPAIDAVQQWEFTPGTLHGQSVDTIFALTVTFQIK
jgi:TonB family protein